MVIAEIVNLPIATDTSGIVPVELTGFFGITEDWQVPPYQLFVVNTGSSPGIIRLAGATDAVNQYRGYPVDVGETFSSSIPAGTRFYAIADHNATTAQISILIVTT
jgi:hypothetical protein